MTRATGNARVSCTVILLDRAWSRSTPGAERIVRQAARATLAGARRTGRYSLNVALADDGLVRSLNARDRGKDKPTNVLSYRSGEKAFLGDIVLARQTVQCEARQQKKAPADHLSHLVVHGILHLLGYDHETETDAARMEALERRVLAKLGIADPYS
jgi:probable rRNA maturation factor